MADLYKQHIMKGISGEQVEEVLEKVKPVIWKDGVLHYIDITGVNRRGIAYLWEPKIGEPLEQPLHRVTRINTVHTFGAPALWKPTLAEAAAQIDPTWFKNLGVVAFTLDTPPVEFQFCHLLENGSIVFSSPDIQNMRVRSETLHFGCMVLYRIAPERDH